MMLPPAGCRRLFGSLLVAWMFCASGVAQERPAERLPSAEEMAASREDVWGEAAIRQPGGPSYEFFRDLLPPLRYVNTDFRHYPIVLSAPQSSVKARWVSNGSAVNARANKPPMWREIGTPVRFLVGADAEPFGNDLPRLDGPRYAEGYWPIVQVAYRQTATRYEQEAFAPVTELADAGAVFVRFTPRESDGVVAARIDAESVSGSDRGVLKDAKGQAVVFFDPHWHWNAESKSLRADLKNGESAVLVVLTRPLPSPWPESPATRYDAERQACIDGWRVILERGTQWEVPEPLVQNAWRALVIGNLMIAVGDRMNYSAGNAYDHLYEGECGDAVRSLLLFGRLAEARTMIGPLLDFNRKDTRYHVAGHKLQLLAHYYWPTRDAEYFREKEAVWKPVIEFIRSSRQANGLLPPDNYAGDIKQQVVSLNSNANCWRGLRDMAAVLADLGDKQSAADLQREAAEFRRVVLDAVANSEHRDTTPPFIPLILHGDEPAHDPLTATRMGSYYDLMIPYVLGSGVFAPGSDRETWIIEYLRQHGGLAMGMIRSTPHQGQFNNEPGVNVLYGLRYMLTILRRDDREHALAGFYGQLAQAMTRETFVGGEGSRFLHGDAQGRSFYLPPNSASNAMFLITLRNLLIQDWDFDDDSRPETLRLLFGAPARWFADGCVLRAERAPTAFGELSFRVESRLNRGEVLLDIDAPPRKPDRWLVRVPLPEGRKVSTAHLAGHNLAVAVDGSVEIPYQPGRFTVRFGVESSRATEP